MICRRRWLIPPVTALLVSSVITVAATGAPAQTSEGRCGSVYQARVSGEPGEVEFDDVTDTSRVEQPLTGMLVHASAASDVNGDGWVDLFVGTFADRDVEVYRVRGADRPAPDRLLLGGPKGFRVDDAFPGAKGRTSGAAFADLDGDSDADLVIARNVRADEDQGDAPSEILRNDGGRFERAAVLDQLTGARSIGVLDYDLDGRLDLFVTEDRWSGGSSVLLRNEGKFTFEDVTDEAGLPDDVDGLGVATADLTGDGAPDIFVGGSNRMFVNDGHGSFDAVDDDAFRWKTFGDEDDPAGVAVGDLNRDGRPEIVVGQHFGSTIDGDERVPVRLYLNRGNDAAGHPEFDDVTDAAGLVGLPTKAPHVEIVDLDSDGWPDILTTASAEGGRSPVVFRNEGADDDVPRFAVVGKPGPVQYWPTGVVFDADRDGRLDVFLAEFDAAKPSLLLRNSGRTGHWLGVEADVGDRVTAYRSGRAGRADSLVGDVTVGGATGFGSGPPPVAWFGLGDASGAVDVRIARAGDTDTLTTLRRQAVDQLVRTSC